MDARSPTPDGLQSQWKSYRGGTAARIAIMSFADHAVKQLPQPPERCNDGNPMWIGGKVYFDSDRHGEFNLYSFDPASGEVRQLTSYQDFPVLNANVGDGRIIFEQGGHLRVFDPATSNTTTLRVAVASDLRETRERRVSNVDYVRNVSTAPDLEQVALEYRGEIVTVPAKKGAPIRNLTQSTGANDRSPAWSPSGSKIAWFSDESGDYALYVTDRNGSGKPRRIAIDGGSASIAISNGRPTRSACRSSTMRTVSTCWSSNPGVRRASPRTTTSATRPSSRTTGRRIRSGWRTRRTATG
jgi:tricorn protease